MTLTAEDAIDIAGLRARYLTGALTPHDVVRGVLSRIAAWGDDAVWIHRLGEDDLLAQAAALDGRDRAALPLYGIPFVIKDNMDLAGHPTTAGCPAYSYTPECDATVVRRLREAGAILVGKTNLDQFATGLVGVRSPHGAPGNAFDRDYIPGGSSSGSAVAVAAGLVSFSLGTDTAGSGRVPAAFNNITGLKPSRGLLSNSGVVPACKSLDCVSVFALNAGDAGTVLDVAVAYDEADEFSRAMPADTPTPLGETFRFAVPKRDNLEFFGNGDGARLFDAAAERLQALGGTRVEIDLTPFLEAARLLYEGPWVAERYAAVGAFIDSHPDDVDPTVRAIIRGAAKFSAADAYAAYYRLKILERRTAACWTEADVLLTPTAGTVYSKAEIAADPIRLNANLGYYTNFLNLLDLCAVAVPAGFQDNGLPFGVSLIAPAFHDARLLALSARYLEALGLPPGVGAVVR
jgi:allophanate hydrolase